MSRNAAFFRPEAFQGGGKTRGYFEGWYFKMVSADLSRVLSFIPGISLSDDPHAFIQVIDGSAGRTDYVRFRLEDFSASTRAMDIRIGPNRFSAAGIELSLDSAFGRIEGRVSHSGWTPYRGSFLHPGIMGPFAWLPFMECMHGLNSSIHRLEGGFRIDGRAADFSGGRGYSEKDWGRSMPRAWLWLQCNHFSDPGLSLMISVARIPWLGASFTGFLGFLYRGGRYATFASYSGARIRGLEIEPGRASVAIRSGGTIIGIDAISTSAGELKAPVEGRMDRIIKESLDAEIRLTLRDAKSGALLLDDSGRRAGLETVGEL